MKILFMSLIDFDTLDQSGIYTDLLREFLEKGHQVDIISPVEKGLFGKTKIIQAKNYRIIKPSIPKITKQTYILKGINTVLYPYVLKYKLKKIDYSSIDLLLYPTPPISIYPYIKSINKLYPKIKKYLLLKDIFPQNAVDLELIKKDNLIYKYFRSQEKKLYELSDVIGCMSPKNKRYLLENNSFLEEDKVTIVPNSIKVDTFSSKINQSNGLRKKWGIPADRTVIAYTGNLGKPQAIGYFIENLKNIIPLSQKVHFVVCGSGTEESDVEKFSKKYPDLLTYFGQLSTKETEEIIQSSNYGLLLLDNRFTIPNCPSRMLAYMKYGKPILAYTDENTDLRELIIEKNLGIWRSSNNNISDSIADVLSISEEKYKYWSGNSRLVLEKMFSTEKAYEQIVRSMRK